ncbi:MAG: TRAP transporter substrate-binding protein DctP [Pseudomonadota bacterium]
MLRKSKLKSTLTSLSLALAGSVFAVADTALAADAEWKMHVVFVPARPEAQAAQTFADMVSEEASDKLNIEVFTGGSLGVKDADMLRILPRGTIIQAALLYPGYMSRDKPEYAYTLPPGVAATPEKLEEILPELREVYEDTYDEAGIKLLGFIGHPARDAHIMCKEPVSSLEELRDRKLRVWEQFHVDVFERLGVSAQVIGQNDLYVAMQTGVVDCAVYPIGLAVTVSLQEVAPYASALFPYVLHPINLIASQSAFDALPEDVQRIVLDASTAVEESSFESYLSGEHDEAALAKFYESGGELLDPFSDEDRAAFVETAREVWKELATAAGGKAEQNYQTISDVVK